MLRRGIGHSFSPCVRSGEVLAFTGSRLDALRTTGLGCGTTTYLFAGTTKKRDKHVNNTLNQTLREGAECK